MTTTATLAYGSITTPTFTGLNSLASATLVVSAAVANTAGADDFLVEVTIADITESGNKAVYVYAVPSLDGSVYADTSILMNLARIGTIDMTGSSAAIVRSGMSVAAAFGGICPQYFKLAVYNDAGVSLASSGNSVRVQPITYLAT